MVRKATKEDLKKVMVILADTYGYEELSSTFMYLMDKIEEDGYFNILINKENSICAIVERIGTFKAQVHIYSLSEVGGIDVKLFVKEGFSLLFSSFNYTSFLTFSPSRKVSLFTRGVGFKSLGTGEDAGGPGVDEEIFYATKDMLKNKLKIGE